MIILIVAFKLILNASKRREQLSHPTKAASSTA